MAGSGSFLVKIPSGLRQSDPSNKVTASTEQQFVEEGGKITLNLRPERRWTKAHDGQYRMVLKRRQYTTTHRQQVGGRMVPQVDFEDIPVLERDISQSNFTLQDDGSLTTKLRLSDDGEYRLTLMEHDEESDAYGFQTLKLYAYDPDGVTNTAVVDDNKIAVVSEKTTYHIGETARILVRLPFSGGKALITREKQNVTDSEIIDLKGNTLIKEWTVDESFMPNTYLSVIAFKPSGDSGVQPEYKVGYAEVVVDKTDKKLFLKHSVPQETYSPREQVKLDVIATDKDGNPVQSELSVAVVDEALIAMMGNIDLDLLPKFFRKLIFQTHTALTNVAMLKHLYFARKGVIGGSGGKEGGDSIFTRTDFKNTAYYLGRIVTDVQGNARVNFTLPDNIGDFRIISIGHSKDHFFGANESTISVRQEIIVEETFPLIARPGDDMRVGATVFNQTETDKTVFVSLDAEGLSTPDDNRQSVTVKAGERSFVNWRVRVAEDDPDRDEITYTITAADEDSGKGDRIQKTVQVAQPPMLAKRFHLQDDFQSSMEHALDLMSGLNWSQSTVELSFSTSILAGVESIVSSLLGYPYGCIEQTISSTLPNAVVKKFDDLLDIGISAADLNRNLQAGITRFSQMQLADGGFSYWPYGRESDAHITPYAVLALVQMRDLGVDLPDEMIEKGKSFVENQVKSLSGNIERYRLSQLVHEAHALSRLDSEVFASARTLLKNRLDELSTHEQIVYALSLAKKDLNNYRAEVDALVAGIDLTTSGNARNWYWNKTADKALYLQLLMRANPGADEITTLVKELYALDWGSYYFSTQAKIQSFIAFTEYLERAEKPDAERLAISYDLGDKSGRVRLTPARIYQKVRFTLADAGSSSDISFSARLSEASDQPVYTNLVIAQVPQDPTSIAAQDDQGVSVNRQYFRLGKVEESDDNWWQRQKRDLAAVSGNTFQLGETYLVEVTVDYEDSQRQVALESYLPAGFKLLNPRLLTEVTQVGEDHWAWPYGHQEFRADRFFASAFSVSDRADTVTYYVRAQVPGTFIEPPVSAYPMYRPEVEGHTAFREIVIEE